MHHRRAFLIVMMTGAVALSACSSDDKKADPTSSSKPPEQTSSTSAPAAVDATVQLADTSLGKVLVDAGGKTLYLFTPDGDAEATTVPEGILGAWPPVVVDGEPTVGEGLDEKLVSTGAQLNGENWLRYGGHLLYTYASDAAPGDVAGQGVGGVWYAVGADGQQIG